MSRDSLKHMEFLQNVITRMNSNSFLIKGWMITLVSALFALAANNSNIRYAIVTYIAIPAFWILDAYYLSRERQYRSLYDHVKGESDTDFSMDATPFGRGRNSWLNAFFSQTLALFYMPVVGITLLVMFCIK